MQRNIFFCRNDVEARASVRTPTYAPDCYNGWTENIVVAAAHAEVICPNRFCHPQAPFSLDQMIVQQVRRRHVTMTSFFRDVIIGQSFTRLISSILGSALQVQNKKQRKMDFIYT